VIFAGAANRLCSFSAAARVCTEVLSIHLSNPHRFDYGGFLRPSRKFFGPVSIDVDASEFLALPVIDGYLPVLMFSTLIFEFHGKEIYMRPRKQARRTEAAEGYL
jgi:hypothetical protein